MIAQTIYEQLGGNRFVTMTGARNLVTTGSGLSFRLPKCLNGINCVKIELNALDLYDIKFIRIRGMNVKEVSGRDNIDVSNLKTEVEAATGLYLSL